MENMPSGKDREIVLKYQRCQQRRWRDLQKKAIQWYEERTGVPIAEVKKMLKEAENETS